MNTKRCPVCGASNSEIAKFCYACGADLRTEGEQADQPVIETTVADTANERLVSESQYQYQDIEKRQENAPQNNGANPYQNTNQQPYQPNPYQAPLQGGYQMPPQEIPYQQPYGQGGYQMPPQGNPYQQPYGYQTPPPYMPPMVPLGYSQKNKLVAGILGILIGVFGVHNFYLGYTGKAVAQLLLTLLGSVFTCGLSAVAVWIWGLVEGIMILTGGIKVDGHNVPLSE